MKDQLANSRVFKLISALLSRIFHPPALQECEKIPPNDMEIIEIGTVLLDNKFNSIDEFQTFMKPSKNPILTDFYNQLTHIHQTNVDHATSILVALNKVSTWLTLYQPLLLKRDCVRSGASWPIPGEHFNT